MIKILFWTILIFQFIGCESRSYADKYIIDTSSSAKEINEKKISKLLKPRAVACIGKNKKMIKIQTNKLIKFDAKDSFDPDGNSTNLTYQWINKNSSIISQKKSFVYKYDKKGLYEATLKVTDEQKLSSIDRVCILVDIDGHDLPLIAKAQLDQELISNKNVRLNGRAICRDDIVRYQWSEGENLLSTKASFENTFEVGKHIIKLTIEDKKGNKATDEIVVSVI